MKCKKCRKRNTMPDRTVCAYCRQSARNVSPTKNRAARTQGVSQPPTPPWVEDLIALYAAKAAARLPLFEERNQ